MSKTPSPQPEAAAGVEKCPIAFTGSVVVNEGASFTCAAGDDFLKFRSFCDGVDNFTLRYERNGLFVWDAPPPPTSNSSFNVIKCFGTFAVDPSVMYDVIHDAGYRSVWDDNMAQGHNICHLNETNDVGYYACKAPYPISPRDFCNQRCWRNCGGGEYIIFNTSVLHPSKPDVKGYVRAFSVISGYLIRPFGVGGCSVTFLTQSNPRGWLPSALVNTLTCKYVPQTLEKLRAVCPKYIDWKASNNPSCKPWITKAEPWATPQPNLTPEWLAAQGLTIGAKEGMSPVSSSPVAFSSPSSPDSSPATA
jgi:hypothetical protein